MFRKNWKIKGRYVDSYIQLSKEYNLSRKQKLEYLYNLLCTEALRFYLSTVQPHVSTFQQAINQIADEYNTAVRQRRAMNYLNSMCISIFVS